MMARWEGGWWTSVTCPGIICGGICGDLIAWIWNELLVYDIGHRHVIRRSATVSS